MKELWLLGLVCVAIGFYCTAYEKRHAEPGLPSMPTSEGASLAVASSTPTPHAMAVGRHSDNITFTAGVPTEEMQRTADPKTLAADANKSANSPFAGLPPPKETPFLDPDVESIGANHGDINRPPVNVGKYLDPNGESSPLSASGATDVEQTPINVGKYLDPDTDSYEPLIVNDGDSGTTHSHVEHYLDPDTEYPGAFGVKSTKQKNVGSPLAADS